MSDNLEAFRCRQLWAAVLALAVDDASDGLRFGNNSENKHEARRFILDGCGQWARSR